jgi:hypothetical protein
MRALVLAACFCAAGFFTPARGQSRHEAAPDLARTALRYVGHGKFTPYRGPWCRDAVNVWLRADGYRTDRSRLALEALYLGPHLPGPQSGALGVMRRPGGGHIVVIVARIGRFVEAVSPNFRGRVALVLYPLRRFLAFIQPLRG